MPAQHLTSVTRVVPARGPVRTVVLAHGVASPAAAALAARAKLPLLDFPQPPLADDVTAQFIRDHGVTHALVLDGHDRLRSPGGSLAQLGVELVPVGGSDLFGAAVASAQFTSDDHAGRFDALSQRDCHSQASPTIGLAAGRNVNSFRSERTDAVISWDAYSAGSAARLALLAAIADTPARAERGRQRSAVSRAADRHRFGACHWRHRLGS